MSNKKIEIPIANPDIGEKEKQYVIDAIESGWIGSKGKYVNLMEKKFSSWQGRKYAIMVSSGTAALHLALLSLNITKGDEVIVPNLTFASPINMVLATGARPVLVDVNRKYWGISPKGIKKAVTKKTKAIIVVHLYGHPVKMDEIIEISKDYNIPIIEDVAEAIGAEYKGKKVGNFGILSTFSFYGNKTITTGEGGAVVTDCKELSEKIRLIRDHGMKPRYWHIAIGFNYRMTNVQAAIGVAQLEKIEYLINKKREIARIYHELLSNTGLVLHPEMPWAKPSYWLYSILVDKKKINITRDELKIYLYKNGIETRPFFYPLHIMPIYKQYASFTYNNSTYLSKRGLSLPSGPKINEEDIKKVVEVLKKRIS